MSMPGADGPPELRASLEAIMLVADEPVPEVDLAQVLERPRHEVAAALRGLASSYQEEGRGFELHQVAGGWRFYTRDDCAPVVERFVRDGQEVRLTQAALETLAVVAYQQPVSRARVSAVRGVNCDGVMRTLTLRGLVEEAGTDGETGAILYRTTGYFLERLGLPALADLPELAPYLPDPEEAEEAATGGRPGPVDRGGSGGGLARPGRAAAPDAAAGHGEAAQDPGQDDKDGAPTPEGATDAGEAGDARAEP
jgi:segregation and condensation protein B